MTRKIRRCRTIAYLARHKLKSLKTKIVAPGSCWVSSVGRSAFFSREWWESGDRSNSWVCTKRDIPENVNNLLYYPRVYFILLNPLSHTLIHLRLLHFLPAECATVIISTDLLCESVLRLFGLNQIVMIGIHYSIFDENDWINALLFT